MKRALLVLSLTLACATPSQPFEGHPVLAKIQFVGNRSISSGELLQKIVTAPTEGPWYTFFLPKTPRYYDADLFAIDEKRIVRWYNEKGFYEASIKNVEDPRDDKGRVTLVVTIDEGKRAIIRKMDFVGWDALPKNEQGDVNAALPIHPGDDFDEDGYEKAKDVLELQLKEHGFAEAKVTGKVEVAPDDGTAHVTFNVDLGQRYRFGKVVVSGNRQIPADQIITATGLNRGDLYSPSAVELAQQRVYNLGAFSGVRVGLEPLGEQPVAAVRVNVHEAPFQTVKFGGGLQIEESRWELPRVHGEYTNRSLFGGLRRLELQSNVGYAFVSSPISWDRTQSGIVTLTSAQLTVPNVLIPSLDFVTRGEFDREIQPGYSYDEVAARVGFLYRRGKHSVAPSLNFVRYFNTRLGATDLTTLLQKGGSAGGLVSECGNGCTLTYPELRYTYDARDNAIETTNGFFASVGFQQALKPGSFNYFRLDPEVRFYTPVGRFLVVAARAQYGGIFPEGGSATPFTQRFFGGGQNWQRGYAPLRQGPKVGAAPCNVGVDAGCDQPYATVGVPVGGTSEVLLSGELRFRADWILNHLAIVPFVDASKVQDSPYKPFSGGLEIAPGIGLRYVTPFGPLRFDIAWNATPKDVTIPTAVDASNNVIIAQTRVSSFCASNTPGCIHESRFAFHLTLGEAF